MECRRCGKDLPPQTHGGSRRIYCSKNCGNAYRSLLAARARRAPVEAVRCPWCRRPLPADRSRQQVYCSKSCKQTAYMARKAGNEKLRRKRCARCRKELPPSNASRSFCSRSCRSATDKGLTPYQIAPVDYTRSGDAGWIYDPVRERSIHAPSIVHSCPLCVRRGHGRGEPRREEDGVWVCDAVRFRSKGFRPCLWVWSGWVDSHNQEEPSMSNLVLSAPGARMG